MSIREDILKPEEKILFSLRELYCSFGYAQYRMRRFEEYDLYAGNKDFLVSDNVITFTDTTGKLMALKPDVTLSIVRGGRDGGPVQKVFYQENVYRVAGYSREFSEITQAGVECIGDLGDYELSEVLALAAESLKRISKNAVLNVSDLSVVSELIGALHMPAEKTGEALRCLSQKNTHELRALCEREGAEPDAAEKLLALSAVSGRADEALPRLSGLIGLEGAARLQRIAEALRAAGVSDMIRWDFSVVNDLGYYNGLVFQGYVEGVPEKVLAGGQYDRLMRKMGRRSGAIGFAVYLDALERLTPGARSNDADALLIYDPGEDPARVIRALYELREQGLSAAARPCPSEGFRAGKIYRLTEKGVTADDA